MEFTPVEVKGLARCLMGDGVDTAKLKFHITQTAPGTSAHPPHTHAGVEAIYVLEGNGTIECEGERQTIGPNESVVVDATRLHGLTNTGSTPMRYLVIIAP